MIIARKIFSKKYFSIFFSGGGGEKKGAPRLLDNLTFFCIEYCLDIIVAGGRARSS